MVIVSHAPVPGFHRQTIGRCVWAHVMLVSDEVSIEG